MLAGQLYSFQLQTKFSGRFVLTLKTSGNYTKRSGLVLETLHSAPTGCVYGFRLILNGVTEVEG
jgi:hypothetical protein